MRVLIVGGDSKVDDKFANKYHKEGYEVFILDRENESADNTIAQVYKLDINNSRYKEVKIDNKQYTVIFADESSTQLEKSACINYESIYDKALSITEQMMKSENIGVYVVSEDNKYLRLVATSRNIRQDEEIKNSYTVAKHKELGQVIDEKKCYINETCNNTEVNNNEEYRYELPRMISPIIIDSKVKVIIGFFQRNGSLSTYQKNLFSVVGSMITSSLVRAYRYEDALVNSKYVAGTRILNNELFKELIVQKKRFKVSNHIEYTILKLDYDVTKGMDEVYNRIKSKFRAVDHLGVDLSSGLYLLLTNTCKREAEFVVKRLADCEVKATFMGEDIN